MKLLLFFCLALVLAVFGAASLPSLVPIACAGVVILMWRSKGRAPEGIGHGANVYSYVVGVFLSIAVGIAFAGALAKAAAFIDPNFPSIIPFAAFVLGTVGFFVVGFRLDEIPTAYGAVLEVAGIRLRGLELREGLVWAPPGVKLSSFVFVGEQIGKMKNTTALAPDTIAVTIDWTPLFKHVRVSDVLGAEDVKAAIMLTGTRDARKYIQSKGVLKFEDENGKMQDWDVSGEDTAVKKKDGDRDKLRWYMQFELKNECQRLGSKMVEVVIEDIRLPKSLEDAAVRKAIEEEEAIAAAVRSDAFALRVKGFAKKTGLPADVAVNALQANEGKIERKAYSIENIDGVAAFLKPFIGPLTRAFGGGGGQSGRYGGKGNQRNNHQQQKGGPHVGNQNKNRGNGP